MHQRSAFGDRSRLPLLQRLAVVAATILAGLLACGALLAALGGPVPRALASGPVTYPGSAPCDTTLQACIDGSVTGTTIVVQVGTYYTNALTLSKPVSLTGVNSATVILHALANQRVLTVTGAAVDSSVIISGLTFAGGHAVGGSCPDGCGGAILINAHAQPLLVNLTITNNLAVLGGGLFVDTGSPLLMSGVAVLSNTGYEAGGAFSYSSMTLTGGLFQNNRCTGIACSGGGLYASWSLIATGTQFLSNTSSNYGAGVFLNGNATLNGALFLNNRITGKVAGAGGGLYASGNLIATGTQFLSNTNTGFWGGGARANGNVTLNGGLFQNNQCTGAGCQGGGLWAGSLAVTNTQFLSNTSTGDGGGAYAKAYALLNKGVFQGNTCTAATCRGGGLFADATLAVTNTLFLGNTAQQGAGLYHSGGSGRLVNDLFSANQAAGQGDALFLASPGAVTLLHTTIASPTLGSGAAVYVTSGTVVLTNTLLADYAVGIENAGGNVREDYSLFSGLSTSFSGTVTSGGNSHTGAANFVDPAAGDYHLALGSAAIDGGVDAGINFDLDGNPRPLGAGFDIGCYEANIRRLFLPLVWR